MSAGSHSPPRCLDGATDCLPNGYLIASLRASLIACIPDCLPNFHPHCMQVLTDCHEPRLVGFTLGSVLAAHASVGRHVLMIQSLGERLHV